MEETFLFNDRSLKILPQIIALVCMHYLIIVLNIPYLFSKNAHTLYLQSFDRITEEGFVDSLFSPARMIYSPIGPPSEWN